MAPRRSGRLRTVSCCTGSGPVALNPDGLGDRLRPPAGAPHTQASATWRVPAITRAQTNTNASFWAGLGGIKSTNVEQAGVQALCRSGHPVYATWWQLYPAPAATVPIDVHPGDVVAVAVANPTGTQVHIEVADLTTGRHARLTRHTPAPG